MVAVILAGLCFLAGIAASVWCYVIIFKRSVIGGILTVVFGFPMFYYLFTGWNEEEGDIKLPFFLSFVFMLAGIGIGMTAIWNQAKHAAEAVPSAPAMRASQSPMRESAPAPAPVQALPSTSAVAKPAQPMAEPPRQATRISDPIPQPRAVPAPEPRRVAAPEPRRPKVAQSDCVYKPVMTEEDLAKCR